MLSDLVPVPFETNIPVCQETVPNKLIFDNQNTCMSLPYYFLSGQSILTIYDSRYERKRFN